MRRGQGGSYREEQGAGLEAKGVELRGTQTWQAEERNSVVRRLDTLDK